jgi:dihydrofolate reductase
MTGICAVSINSSGRYVIGSNGKLSRCCANDMRWFSFITSGETVVMGRKTMESLGCKPLKGRRNIVLSRSMTRPPEGFELIRYFEDNDDIPYNSFIIGGAELFNATMKFMDKMFVTFIFDRHEGDCFIDSPFDKFEDYTLIKEFDDCNIWMLQK